MAQQKPFIVISRNQRKMCDEGCFTLYESWYLWKPKVCPFILPLSALCSTGIESPNYLGQKKVKQTLHPLRLKVRTSPSDDRELTN